MSCCSNIGFIPELIQVKWIEANRVRLRFKNGRISEVTLPWVKTARRAKVVDNGDGLGLGNGQDISAGTAYTLPGKIIRKGRTPRH